MARVKNSVATRARRKKFLRRAKGYFGSKHLLYKTAKEQVLHSLQYSYNDRKKLKGDYRKLWIRRINAGCRQYDLSYSCFINGLRRANILINRKMLSELAINDPKAFEELIKLSKKAQTVKKAA